MMEAKKERHAALIIPREMKKSETIVTSCFCFSFFCGGKKNPSFLQLKLISSMNKERIRKVF